jgi:hypothetical protein
MSWRFITIRKLQTCITVSSAFYSSLLPPAPTERREVKSLSVYSCVAFPAKWVRVQCISKLNASAFQTYTVYVVMGHIHPSLGIYGALQVVPTCSMFRNFTALGSSLGNPSQYSALYININTFEVYFKVFLSALSSELFYCPMIWIYFHCW